MYLDAVNTQAFKDGFYIKNQAVADDNDLVVFLRTIFQHLDEAGANLYPFAVKNEVGHGLAVGFHHAEHPFIERTHGYFT